MAKYGILNLYTPARRFIYCTAMDAPKFSAEYRAAFDKAALPFYKDIYHIAWLKTRNEADASDLTQKAYLAAYEKFDTLKDTTKIRAWLAAILHNLFLQMLAQRKNTKLMCDWKNFEDTPDEMLPTQVDAEKMRIEEVLERLAPIQREVFECKYLKNMAYAEIAEMYGKSIGAVKNALAKARENIMRIRFRT